MMNKLIIVGAGQQGKVCKRLAEKKGFKIAGFVDEFKDGYFENVPIYKNIQGIKEFKSFYYFLAFGEMKPRARYFDLLKKLKLETINLIDDDAIIEEGAVIGNGNYISKGSIIFSSATIGDFNIINCNAVIATDVKIGDNNNISLGCNICGGTIIGDNCYIGCNASVTSGYKIGNNVTIGAGAVVLNDVEDNVFVCGIPAVQKKRKYRYDTSKPSA